MLCHDHERNWIWSIKQLCTPCHYIWLILFWTVFTTLQQPKVCNSNSLTLSLSFPDDPLWHFIVCVTRQHGSQVSEIWLFFPGYVLTFYKGHPGKSRHTGETKEYCYFFSPWRVSKILVQTFHSWCWIIMTQEMICIFWIKILEFEKEENSCPLGRTVSEFQSLLDWFQNS